MKRHETFSEILERNKHLYKGYSQIRPPMIKYPVIEIPHGRRESEFFVMTVPSTSPETEKITAEIGGLLENDEILAEDGIYCYVICQLARNEDSQLDVTKEIKLVAKKVQTIQEVHSAHGYILRDLQIAHTISSVKPAIIVLYAGELRVSTTSTNNKHVDYNFMSGTYMFVNQENRPDIFPTPSRESINISGYIIQSKLHHPILLAFDQSNETYLTPEDTSIQMTKDKLISYFNIPGITLKKFDTYDEAVSYYMKLNEWIKNKSNAEARIYAITEIHNRTRRHYANQTEFDEALNEKIREWQEKIDNINFEQKSLGTQINTSPEIGLGIRKRRRNMTKKSNAKKSKTKKSNAKKSKTKKSK